MSEAIEYDPGLTVGGYFDLVARGLLEADDRVELLEGLVVASPPQGPLHASVTMGVDAALRKAIGDRASIRVQMPLLAGPRSAPEPDIALVHGTASDYRDRHPSTAFLVVEIAESSLPQDRLTKSRIYARAGVPEYWIVNLRDRKVEVHTNPDIDRRSYATIRSAVVGEDIELVSLPGAQVAVVDLLPGY